MILYDITKWIGLNPKERNGSIVLLSLIVIITLTYHLINRYYNPPVDLSAHQRMIIDSLIRISDVPSGDHSIYYRLEDFDPNNISKAVLESFGVPQKIATTWVNYINKGGNFKKPEELLKIYGMNQELYDTLYPYINIANENPRKVSEKTTTMPRIKEDKKILFSFDPNTLSGDSLKLLDLPNRVINNLVSYRATGARLSKPEHLKKIYGMSDSIYGDISPYINIRSLQDTSVLKTTTPEYFSPKLKSININTADSATLVQLKGIGPVRAKFIIRRRDNIGGFYSLEQLYDDIYTLDSLTVSSIWDYIYVDSSYQRISLNNISLRELLKNYYFDYNMSKTAVNFFKERSQHEYLDDFIESSPLPKEKWVKVLPYLRLE